MNSNDIEMTRKHLAAMAKFGTGVIIPHDDIILHADPDWDGTHARDTGKFPSSREWLRFRAWARKQPHGIAGYRFANVRGQGYRYEKIT